MTWLASDLTERIQIRQAVDTPNDDGGYDRSYTTLLTVWSGIKSLSFKSRYFRGEQVEYTATHEFKIRRIAIATLGTTFSSGFGSDFDSIKDLNPLKSDYFIFVQRGSTIKGRLFRIHEVIDKDERREYLRIYAEEIEEVGTGYPV